MYDKFFQLPIDIVSSAYGSGAYNGSTYNGSSTTSSSNSSSSGSTAPVATTATLAVTFVDTNVPFVAGAIQDVSTQPVCIGTAPANSTVIVTFNPGNIVCKTTADSSGKWTCQPTQQISLGLHTVSITATTPQGQTVTLASFQVDATHSNVVQNVGTTTHTLTPKATSHSSILDITFIFIILALLIGFLIWFFLKKRKKDDKYKRPGGPPNTPMSPPTTNSTPPTTPTSTPTTSPPSTPQANPILTNTPKPNVAPVSNVTNINPPSSQLIQ